MGDGGFEHGTYILLLHRDVDKTVRVGSKGDRDLPAGYYGYVGSAFGPGGLRRLARHHDVATGANTTRHWHIDYILQDASIVTAYVSPQRIECDTAKQVTGKPVPGIGASDCSCRTHLFFKGQSWTVSDSVDAGFERAPPEFIDA